MFLKNITNKKRERKLATQIFLNKEETISSNYKNIFKNKNELLDKRNLDVYCNECDSKIIHFDVEQCDKLYQDCIKISFDCLKCKIKYTRLLNLDYQKDRTYTTSL